MANRSKKVKWTLGGLMKLIEELRVVLGGQHVLIGKDKERYSSDWLGQYSFEPLCVVRPASTEEVSKVVKLAIRFEVKIVPVGGNTGLSGGTHSDNTISISMERMNRIIAVSYTHLTLPTTVSV